MTTNVHNRMTKFGFVLEKIDSASELVDFDCGDADLNDYFHNDSAKYKESLLTRTYALYDSDGQGRSIVALVDFCNDALARKLMAKREQRKINHNKRGYSVYPAVKITRLGVDVSAQGRKIGSTLLGMIKEFCSCRLISG